MCEQVRPQEVRKGQDLQAQGAGPGAVIESWVVAAGLLAAVDCGYAVTRHPGFHTPHSNAASSLLSTLSDSASPPQCFMTQPCHHTAPWIAARQGPLHAAE